MPCCCLFLVVLIFHFQSWQELVWGELDYSCIQWGSISCLAGSDINWKRKPTCKWREIQYLLLLPVFFNIDYQGHLHLLASLLGLMHKSALWFVPLPASICSGHFYSPPGVFSGLISIQICLWGLSPLLTPKKKSKRRCSEQSGKKCMSLSRRRSL